jgi:hypothetical protein
MQLLLPLGWLLGLVALSRAEEQPPWLVNPPIATVQKSLYRKSPKPKTAALIAMEYVGPKRERMEWQALELADDITDGRWEESRARWSNDDGATWSEFAAIRPPTNVKYQGITFWEGGLTREYDPVSGVLVELWLRQLIGGGLYRNYTYYRLSRDQGRTWSLPRQLRYEPGADFDPAQPAKPEFLDPNHGYPSSNILVHSSGNLVVILGSANVAGDRVNRSRPWKMGAVYLLGKWNTSARDYEWTAGHRSAIAPEISSRGLLEPALAELSGGRILAVYRGSDTAKTPGRKWYHVSGDGGKTFNAIQEWRYDDGSRFYSPSSIHRLIRHSVTKKLYWLGNLCATPPGGNSPRYPLVIAEVDESIPALKKKTVTVIDDRRPEQPASLQLSNFSLLENRSSHELEVYLCTYGQDASDPGLADSWKYTLRLKDGQQ